MRKNQTSLTALGIAVTRAIESKKPEGERVCYDPFARKMVPGWLYAMTRFFVDTGYAELRGPGVQGFLIVRERYIDDYLRSCLRGGIRQLVILGAGYDSRAYRFEEMRGPVKAFEVDHPATQADKLARLEKIFGQAPSYVTYVPVDFTTQSLEERLMACGYQSALKTLFIWQGVTMYLNAASMDGTLAFIRQCAGPGSAVIFDYIYQSVLEGEKGHGEVSGMRRYRGMTGEALSFGIPRGEAEAYLQARGFVDVRSIDSQDLKALYFIGPNASRKVVPGYGIISGVVPG